MKERKKAMKQKKNSKAITTTKKYSWLWIALPAIIFGVWAMDIDHHTLSDFGRPWIGACTIIGFAVGVVRLIRDKEIVWDWTEYLGAIFYTFIHSVWGFAIGLFLIYGIKTANYYIPTNHPCYKEYAIVIDKKKIPSRVGSNYKVEVDFENEKFGIRNLWLGKGFYDSVEKGEKYMFTLQNGLFNMPVIRNITKQKE